MTWEDAIESYKTYLILEKSLSSNSVEAYLNDIKKLAKYCADKHHVTTPDAISYDHLKDYLMSYQSYTSEMYFQYSFIL